MTRLAPDSTLTQQSAFTVTFSFPPSLFRRSFRPLRGRLVVLPYLALVLQLSCEYKSEVPQTANADMTGSGGESSVVTPDSRVPPAAIARLLTRREYQNTVEDLFKTETQVTENFPPEPAVNGFSNNARSHQINPLLVEEYQKAARVLAQEALDGDFESLPPCVASADDEARCALDRLLGFARQAFRRPLKSDEQDTFAQLFGQVRSGLGEAEAMAAVVEGILMSPQFLYRIEAPPASDPGDSVPLGPYALASRLSYFLTGTMPDEELLESAESEALLDEVVVEAQARRLLEEPRAKEQVSEFHDQWLGLPRIKAIARNGVDVGYQEAQLESIRRFLDATFWSESSSLRELYTSDQVFLNQQLGALYGANTSSEDWELVSQPGERFGLITQPALLSLLAHADQSAPVKRGVFVRETLLCQEVPAPPPNVNNNPPDPDPNLTTRERFAVHTADGVCAQCHSVIDPIGFGFEAYDHLGRLRSEENGIPVDTSGELSRFAEEQLNGPISGAEDLSNQIAASTTALSCLAENWLTFALGRSVGSGDEKDIDRAIERAQQADSSMKELIVALTTSEVFLTRAAHDLDGGGN